MGRPRKILTTEECEKVLKKRKEMEHLRYLRYYEKVKDKEEVKNKYSIKARAYYVKNREKILAKKKAANLEKLLKNNQVNDDANPAVAKVEVV